jgi:hypothetical protein
MSKIKILFLAANPSSTDPLRLDEEIRSIDHSMRQSELRDRFDIEQHWAVRIGDLQEYLLRHKPHVVHFSGHGSVSGEIILLDDTRNSVPVSSRALSSLFLVLKDNIRCVVLNACYSESQARAIAEHIDYVIGMTKAIGDNAAINFASSFYRALGYGRSIKNAFDLGCIQIGISGLPEHDIPKLIARNDNSEELILTQASLTEYDLVLHQIEDHFMRWKASGYSGRGDNLIAYEEFKKVTSSVKAWQA